jgi:hypothetical protein
MSLPEYLFLRTGQQAKEEKDTHLKNSVMPQEEVMHSCRIFSCFSASQIRVFASKRSVGRKIAKIWAFREHAERQRLNRLWAFKRLREHQFSGPKGKHEEKIWLLSLVHLVFSLFSSLF